MTKPAGRLRRFVENISERVGALSLPSIVNGAGEDFYQNLRRRVSEATGDLGPADRMTGFILAAPDLAHLCARLLLDSRVSKGDKAKLAAVLIYFASPVDLLPEAVLGPVGWLDNVVLLAYVLNGLVNRAGPEVVREYWAGDEDILELLSRILAAVNDLFTGRLAEGLEKLAGRSMARIAKAAGKDDDR